MQVGVSLCHEVASQQARQKGKAVDYTLPYVLKHVEFSAGEKSDVLRKIKAIPGIIL